MSCLPPIRRSALRPPSRSPRGPAATPYANALSSRPSRCTSTLSPTTIAALLTPAPLSSSAHTAPSDGGQLTINGFVRTVRKQKRIAFAGIGDGSTLQTVQAVLPPHLAQGLSTGVAVAVTGKWTPSLGKEQSHELQVESVRIWGENDAAAYPMQKKYQTPDFLRTLPHLRSRLPWHSLVLRLRSLVTAHVTSYFAKHDFVQCHPPIITSSDCEGAGEVFTVAPEAASPPTPKPTDRLKQGEDWFFGSPKYLTVSSQLHLEALAQSVNKVWTLSPTFRAEKSDTARHLSEFYMLEAEVAFVEDVNQIMDVVEDMLRSVTLELQSSTVGHELLQARVQAHEQEGGGVSPGTLALRWRGLIAGSWPRITYGNAVQQLKDAVAQGKVVFEFAPGHEDGLQTEHERYLAESVGLGKPIFVTDYPRNIKPFYMAPSADTQPESQAAATVACFDLLVPEICELVGGSMREHRLPELLKAMKERGLEGGAEPDDVATEGSLQWYVDLRRYGSVPHGGFGLGFDRLVCYLSGVANIRDVVSFPRWHKRCDC